MRNWVLALGAAALLAIPVGYHLLADDAPKKADTPAKEAAAKPATHKVEKEPLKVEVSLKGILEAGDMTEVALHPESADAKGLLSVLKAVEQGTVVKQGDTLLTLDPEKIDQLIKDAETDSRLADLTIKQAEEELPILEKLLPIELMAAERSKRLADEDLKYFLQVDRPLSEKSAKHQVRTSEEYLDYAKEELKQLEKMYRSKDLTEETEEIILRRTRNQVENAAFYLEMARNLRDQTLKITLPRQQVTLTENSDRQTLLLDKARSTLPLSVSQKRLALAKARYDEAKASDRLQKLKKDRELFTVKAPTDGIVYYGKSTHGQWTTGSSVAPRLTRGGTVMPDEVIFTLVKPRPVFVRATVEEKERHLLKPGLKGKAVVTAFPDVKLPARVESVSIIPTTPGNFDARIAIEPGKDDEAALAGMACTIKFIPYHHKAALTVPAASVFSDDLDEDEHYVYVPGKDGKAEKRLVKVGKTAGDKIEILGGLQEGDEILQDKPGHKTAAGGKQG
jgi:multidrug efflux pump subunit AcrA (membrane-fusion protein)